MVYISPHRPTVSRAKLIKVDSVTLSHFLFIVLVSIANKPPLAHTDCAHLYRVC